MASGIYMLTFSSGKYYVGKSLDLETRWRQHFNKFALGKAARPMQLEYDRCGLPETEAIFSCHRDHIDILEELLIAQFKGPDMLNTTYPDCELTDEVATLINRSHDLLKQSTFEHIQELHDAGDKIASAELREQEARDQLQDLRTRGYIVNEDYLEAVELANEFKARATKRKLELERLRGLSWWDRLFNYRVYV